MSCFINNQTLFGKFIHTHLYYYLHKVKAIQGIELSIILLMDLQTYLINKIAHTFAQLSFHSTLLDKINRKFLSKDFQIKEHYTEKGNILMIDQQTMVYNFAYNLCKIHHQI